MKHPFPTPNEPRRERAGRCPRCGDMGMLGATSDFRMDRGGNIIGTVTFGCGYSANVAPGLHGYYVERLSVCAR